MIRKYLLRTCSLHNYLIRDTGNENFGLFNFLRYIFKQTILQENINNYFMTYHNRIICNFTCTACRLCPHGP